MFALRPPVHTLRHRWTNPRFRGISLAFCRFRTVRNMPAITIEAVSDPYQGCTERTRTKGGCNAGNQPDQTRGDRATGRRRRHAGLPRVAGRDEGAGDLRLHHGRDLRGRARIVDLPRPDRRRSPIRHAQRRDARRVRGLRRFAHRAGGPQGGQHGDGDGPRPLLEDRRGPAAHAGPGRRQRVPVHAVRGARRPPRLRGVRPARHQVHVHLRRQGARIVARAVEHAGRRFRRGAWGPHRARHAGRPAGRGRAPLAFRDHAGHVVVSDGAGDRPLRRAPLHLRQSRRPHHRHGPVLPPDARGRAGARRRLPVRRDQEGLHLLRRPVGRALPVRQVRPGVRPRVQLRRDGEHRPGHRARPLHVLLEGQRLRPRGPRPHPAARARAHVVRRPGDHEVVERPVAQRVLRHVHGLSGRMRGRWLAR